MAATAAVSFLVQRVSPGTASAPSLTLLFVLPVAFSAYRFGLSGAVLTLVLSALAWVYLYPEPAFNWVIEDPHDLFALEAFLVVSLLLGGFALAFRHENERLERQARTLSDQYVVSQRLVRLATVDTIVSFTWSYLVGRTRLQIVVALDRSGEVPSGRIYPENNLSRDERDAIDTLLAQSPVPIPKKAMRAGRFVLLPMDGHRGRVGVAGLALPAKATLQDEEQIRAFLSQAAIAVERARLARAIEAERMARPI